MFFRKGAFSDAYVSDLSVYNKNFALTAQF